jgi:hypothetical protein
VSLWKAASEAISTRLSFLTIRVLCGQIFVPEQKFLVYGSGDVSKHASPNHSGASLNLILEPGLYMLLRFQKAAVRGNYETGNQAFSMHLRFLTIRHPFEKTELKEALLRARHFSESSRELATCNSQRTTRVG